MTQLEYDSISALICEFHEAQYWYRYFFHALFVRSTIWAGGIGAMTRISIKRGRDDRRIFQK